jgi:elongation factor Tu
MSERKEERTLIICIIGHVDHGKTTLVSAITKAISILWGLSKALTYLDVKRTKEEKERSVTIVVSTNQSIAKDEYGNVIKFITQDCPGHRDYLKNLISGSANVDYAVVAVSASKGWEEQTSTHVELIRSAYLAKAPEYRIVFFAITQTDLVDRDETMLEITKMDIEERLKPYIEAGVFSKVEVIPCSAGIVTGVAQASPEVYQEEFNNVGKLVKAIIAAPAPTRPVDEPFLMEVDKSNAVPGIGTILVGTIKQGKVKSGDQIDLYLLKKNRKETLTVVSVEAFKSKLEFGSAGQSVGIATRGAALNRDDVDSGSFVAAPNSLKLMRGFTGMCYVISPLGKGNSGVIQSGAEQCMVVGTNTYTCRIVFLTGLNDEDKQSVINLIKKHDAKPRRATDKFSLDLQEILKRSSFTGAKFDEKDTLVYEAVVMTCDELTKLPFRVGGQYVGQESRQNKISFKAEEVF